MLKRAMHSPHDERGFTLLEILIAVVILSIGLLGLAGLQTRSLQTNQSAMMRSLATVLAYDIVDRMRANRAKARDGGYNQVLAAPPPAGGTIEKDDIIAWLADIARKLPTGDGAINVNADIVTVTVQWNDSRGAAAAQQFVVESRL